MNYEEIEQSLKILKFKKINQISEIDFLWRKETQNKYNNFRKGKISKKVLNSNLQEINLARSILKKATLDSINEVLKSNDREYENFQYEKVKRQEEENLIKRKRERERREKQRRKAEEKRREEEERQEEERIRIERERRAEEIRREEERKRIEREILAEEIRLSIKKRKKEIKRKITEKINFFKEKVEEKISNIENRKKQIKNKIIEKINFFKEKAQEKRSNIKKRNKEIKRTIIEKVNFFKENTFPKIIIFTVSTVVISLTISHLRDRLIINYSIFKGSAEKENNLPINSEYQKALTLYKNRDFFKAEKLIKSFLKKRPYSKDAWALKAAINAFGLGSYRNALKDIDKALDIDDGYAFAHALKAEFFYWGLGGSFSKTNEFLKKGINLSPEDPHINFIAGDIQYENGFQVLGGDTYDLDKKSKDKKVLSLRSFEEAKKSFEKILANIYLDNYKNPLAENSYNLDLIYISTALLGDTNFELYFLYKNMKKGSQANKYLKEALDNYSEAISIAPSQEEVEKLELERGLDLYSPAELYTYRGNVYSWMNNKWNNACRDWKVAKKYGNKEAQENIRIYRCN